MNISPRKEYQDDSPEISKVSDVLSLGSKADEGPQDSSETNTNQDNPTNLCDVSAMVEQLADLYRPSSPLPTTENYTRVHGYLTPEDLESPMMRVRRRRRRSEERPSASPKRSESQRTKYISPYNQHAQTKAQADPHLRKCLDEQEALLHRTSRTLREYIDRREREEMAECTFKPNLAPSRALFQARCDKDPNFRRKFYERNDLTVMQRNSALRPRDVSPQRVHYSNQRCEFLNDLTAADAYLHKNRLGYIRATTRQRLDIPQEARKEREQQRRAQTARAVEKNLSQKTRAYLNTDAFSRLHSSTPTYMQTKVYRDHERAMQRLERLYGPYIQREMATRTGSRPRSAPGWNAWHILGAKPAYTQAICDDVTAHVYHAPRAPSVGEDSSFSTRLAHMSAIYRAQLKLSARSSGTKTPPLHVSALDPPVPSSPHHQTTRKSVSLHAPKALSLNRHVVYSNSIPVLHAHAFDSQRTPELFRSREEDIDLADMLIQSTNVTSSEPSYVHECIKYCGPVLCGDLSPARVRNS